MSAFDDPKLRELNELIRTKMEETQTPGFAVGILSHGEVYTASFGVTNVENPLEVTPNTLFQIGSITKTFTGLAAAILAEEGKLDFDAPVRQYLPDFSVEDEEASAAVKVIHLFTHAAGWVGDIFRDTGQGDDALDAYVKSLKNVPQQFAPGTSWAYNNAAFGVAGRVIEVITGQTVESFIEERILKPLGMNLSFLFPRDVITRRTASGHNYGGEKGPQVANPWWLARQANCVGSLASPVLDMLKYARFQLAGDGLGENGERIIGAEWLAKTHQHIAPAGNYASGMGIAWILRSIGGKRAINHNGGTNGQLSNMTVVPEEKFAIIALTNGDRGSAVNGAVVNWALKHFANAEEPTPETITLPEDKLASYAGFYKANLSHARVTPKGDGLEVQMYDLGGFPDENTPPGPAEPPFDVAFFAEDKIIGTSGLGKGMRAEFLRNDDGSLRFLRLGGRMFAYTPLEDQE